MEMHGERRIPAPREAVWARLNDAETLKNSIPGCQEIEKTSDTEFTAKVRAKVGPVSATFQGKVTLSDLDPPNGYTISGEGQGGVAGFAKGGAKVSLETADGETVLRYEVQASEQQLRDALTVMLKKGIPVFSFAEVPADLEDVFMSLTK